MKKDFETPEVKVIPFEVEDVVTSSPDTDTGTGGLPVLPGT